MLAPNAKWCGEVVPYGREGVTGLELSAYAKASAAERRAFSGRRSAEAVSVDIPPESLHLHLSQWFGNMGYPRENRALGSLRGRY